MYFRDRKRDNVIVCPSCGREYLPAEIYVPSAFFGKPTDIDRTTNGEIEVFDGTTMDTQEEFVCENCGVTFVVNADVRFKTHIKEGKKKFDKVYVSPLYSNKISLFENLESVAETTTEQN